MLARYLQNICKKRKGAQCRKEKTAHFVNGRKIFFGTLLHYYSAMITLTPARSRVLTICLGALLSVTTMSIS